MDGVIAVHLTLDDVIERIKTNPTLSPARRRDLISAVLRICDLVGVDPQVTPASLAYMRPLIKQVRPARHNISPKTWSNLRANLRAAVVAPQPRQPREQDPEWDSLLRLIPARWNRDRLSGPAQRVERLLPTRRHRPSDGIGRGPARLPGLPRKKLAGLGPASERSVCGHHLERSRGNHTRLATGTAARAQPARAQTAADQLSAQLTGRNRPLP